MRHLIPLLLPAMLAGCYPEEASRVDDPKFPLERHELIPQYWPGQAGAQVAVGQTTGMSGALEQPIGFSHTLHAQELGINCQMCHSEARKSIHAGVPPVQTCMNCHEYVKTDSVEVQKIHMYYCGKPKCETGTDLRNDEFGQPIPPENSQPIPWKKVHDLPDYVHFSHKRHIGGGVDCTECHGQIQLQGEFEMVPVTKAESEQPFIEGMEVPEGGEMVEVRKVKTVMVRETTLQMGWCLDCHASHPSIDKNYGELSDLRRAELKDCWTCHK